MVDIVPGAKRSAMMSGIRGKDTRPEMFLRCALHRRGFRFRLHDRKLPGQPDLVFSGLKAVLLVHGCFWHGHNCKLFKWPKTRADFWHEKISKNRENDARVMEALSKSGWRVGVVWECALKGTTRKPHDEVINLCSKWLKSENRRLDISGLTKTS